MNPSLTLDDSQGAMAVQLSRFALEQWVQNGKPPTRALVDQRFSLPSRFEEPRAVFVTLQKAGQLRGCIGTVEAWRELWLDIVENAGAAALKDPRFPPVEASELIAVELEVSVLTPPQAVSGPDEITLGVDGVVISLAKRRALYLPQVAPSQGWDIDATLDSLCRKAGLPSDAWRDPKMEFLTFQAQVFR